VIAEVDMGQPLLEVPIPLTHPADDDIEALEARIHAVEHEAIVKGTQLAIQNLSSTSS
jgi:folate-dependent phosphoribosylglycinamide formyltransferase PurN